jgi:hypothetical protein
MYDLALLHAAARCKRVTLRGTELKQFHRRRDESPIEFYDRLAIGTPDERPEIAVSDKVPVLAILHQGNVELPDGSCSYALFREQTVTTISASDLL